MPTRTDKCLSEFALLSKDELHRQNQRLRAELSNVEWLLGASLLETQRRNLHRELGYSSVTEYAQKALNLSPQKSMELLSTARTLEELPRLSKAFRKGDLSWGKVRELKRVATPETEQVWVDFALDNGVTEVQRKVAVSPTEWKRGRALEASLEGQPTATTQEVTKVLNGPPELPGPKYIRVVHHLTPDQYAQYEQAEKRVRARHSKRMTREEVLVELCASELSGGTAKARARHQVLVHTCPESDTTWYETKRGTPPADPKLAEQTKAKGREIQVGVVGRTTSHGKSPGRRAIPNGVLRTVFARAGNACERCGSRSAKLDVHHTTPVSEGGGNEAEDLEVLCKACHTAGHESDYEARPHWKQARQRNQRTPRARKRRAEV